MRFRWNSYKATAVAALAAASMTTTVTASAHEIGVRPGDGACDESAPSAGFFDVEPDGAHTPAIDCLTYAGVVAGKSADRYDPGAAVTRGQVATLLARTIGLTDADLPPGGDAFDDDDGSVHEDAIDRLAAAGVIRTDIRTFRPNEPATRGSMAGLVDRAHTHAAGTPLPAGHDAFHDDDGHLEEDHVDALADAGVVTGTGDGRYEPAAAVTRGQMATFAGRLLDLLVETGHAAPVGGHGALLYDDHPEPSANDYRLLGDPWDPAEIAYAYVSSTEDPVDWRGAIESAMRAWEAASNGTVKFVHMSQAGRPAELVIGFADRCYSHDWGQDCFDGRGGTLASATLGDYRPKRGFVFFDDAETWSSNGSGIDLETVALHELGHTLGIAHSDVHGATMHAFYAGTDRTLHDDDGAAVRKLYPAPAQPEPQPEPEPEPEPDSPSTSVTIKKGGSAVGQPYCDHSSCAYILTRATGLPKNASMTVSCQENHGAGWQVFWQSARTTDSSGNLAWDGCYFGYPNQQVRVVVHGVASNTLTW